VKDKISFSWKEKIKSKQIKKDLEENKENIINPNTEDTKTDEEFQKVIETAVAEKAEEEENEKKEEKAEEKKEEKKETKKEEKKEDKSEEKQEEKAEASVFDETVSLDTPSEKVLDDKEKKMIDRIIIEATTLKNG
jgi:phage I-like protein